MNSFQFEDTFTYINEDVHVFMKNNTFKCLPKGRQEGSNQGNRSALYK
jgi:hypothetical protein